MWREEDESQQANSKDSSALERERQTPRPPQSLLMPGPLEYWPLQELIGDVYKVANTTYTAHSKAWHSKVRWKKQHAFALALRPLRFVAAMRHREMQSSNKKTVAVVILAGLRGMRSSHGLWRKKEKERGLFNKYFLRK